MASGSTPSVPGTVAPMSGVGDAPVKSTNHLRYAADLLRNSVVVAMAVSCSPGSTRRPAKRGRDLGDHGVDLPRPLQASDGLITGDQVLALRCGNEQEPVGGGSNA